MSLRMNLGISVLGLLTTWLSTDFERGRAEAQSLDDCGNIYVEAEASCTVEPPSVSCDLACEPLRLEAACAGRAYVRCEGGCDASLDVGCSASCEASCQAECRVDPGEFDCQAYCQADCSADCSAECGRSGDKTKCEASCKASCSGDCNANCKVRPPQVDCMADCKASCTGSCHAKANFDCQIDCQSELYVQCEAELSGGCKGQCMSEQGALFCEGNYVDTRDRLDSCVEALRAKLDVEVEGYAEGECGGGMCAGEAGGGVSCSALPGAGRESQAGVWSSLSLLAGLGLVLARRRKK